jgi:hypothetical protein
MLESKEIITTFLGDTLRASMTKGCLQSGVLLLLLWSLVMNDLLWELNNDGLYTVRYADDTDILINGKFLQTVSDVFNRHLCVQFSSDVIEQAYPSTSTTW